MNIAITDFESVRPVVTFGSYTPEFTGWLRDNFDIFKRFCIEADKVRRVRGHYSARTLIEYIRHETTLSERGIFKVDNNVAPDCARLYMAARGCNGFFETRGR